MAVIDPHTILLVFETGPGGINGGVASVNDLALDWIRAEDRWQHVARGWSEVENQPCGQTPESWAIRYLLWWLPQSVSTELFSRIGPGTTVEQAWTLISTRRPDSPSIADARQIGWDTDYIVRALLDAMDPQGAHDAAVYVGPDLSLAGFLEQDLPVGVNAAGDIIGRGVSTVAEMATTAAASGATSVLKALPWWLKLGGIGVLAYHASRKKGR